MIFKLGDFLKSINPYKGEGEYLVIDYDYNEDNDFHGYKCARLKGIHVKSHDFDNCLIIDKWSEKYYKKVG